MFIQGTYDKEHTDKSQNKSSGVKENYRKRNGIRAVEADAKLNIFWMIFAS